MVKKEVTHHNILLWNETSPKIINNFKIREGIYTYAKYLEQP